MIENKKASILLILKVLEEYSDEEHYLTHQQIIDKVYEIYDIQLERKSVAFAIELLQELEYDINKGPHGGFALLSRNLDITEIQFIVDSIFSSKSLTGKQAKQIADKISGELSIYQRKDYSYLNKTTELNRSTNKDLFYNIDVIHEAMKRGKRVGFQYLTYDRSGNPMARKDGFQYIVSPYYLVNNFGRYYLICNYREKYHAIQTFRIDYMMNIEIKEDWPIKRIESLEGMKDKRFSLSEYLNDHIYLFGGDIITAELEIEEEWAIQYVKDWFGDKAKLRIKDEKIVATVKCNETALIYWILQYGEFMKVLSPSSLIDKVLETAHRTIDKYGK